MLNNEGYSLADLATATGGGSMGGNSGAWWIIILFLFCFMGGGMFGGNGNLLGQNDLQRAIDLNSIQEGQANLSANIQRNIYETTGAIKDASYNNLSEIRDIQAAVASGFANQQTCCCTTQRAIDGVNYNLATQSAAIQANSTANTQKILDAISANKMADMQNEINQLQLQSALCGVMRYPTAATYSAGYAPLYASSCGCSGM
jgi:hypothetical protein